jgi:hypothetical protein
MSYIVDAQLSIQYLKNKLAGFADSLSRDDTIEESCVKFHILSF